MSETKDCEVMEARWEEGPKQNTHTLPLVSTLVFCGCGLMIAKKNTEAHKTEFLRVVLGPGAEFGSWFGLTVVTV